MQVAHSERAQAIIRQPAGAVAFKFTLIKEAAAGATIVRGGGHLRAIVNATARLKSS